MAVPVDAPKRVRMVTYLPPEVAEWLNQKASDQYKAPSRWVRDLLINTYRKETQAR